MNKLIINAGLKYCFAKINRRRQVTLSTKVTVYNRQETEINIFNMLCYLIFVFKK